MMNLHVLSCPDAIPAYPTVRRVGPADLKDALAKGITDFLPILDFLAQPVGWHFGVRHRIRVPIAYR